MSTDQEQRGYPDVPFTVGIWRVDPLANEMHQDTETVKLEPKVMRVLCLLAARAGSVVSRDDLESEVWSGMVVTTDAVTNTIIKLRKVFGDDSRNPRYIETISKSGYRLIAEVDRDLPKGPVPPPSSAPPRRQLERLLVPLLIAIGAGLWLALTNEEPAAPGEGLDAVDMRQQPSIAVLPFDNPGADPTQDYFADGITEDLITDLSKFSGLWVVARNSAFAYRGSPESEQIIARELGVTYLLKGSVRRSGERVRINARLTEGKNGGNLWAERYDIQIDDIFEIQDEITARIVAALQLEIAPADRSRMTQQNPASVDAYDALLRGLDYFGRRSPDDNRLAKEHYERAIAIDPGFARAYVGLAMVYARDAADGWEPGADTALIRAAELTEKARRLDPSLPQIYFVEGLIELFRRNYETALRNAEHAISIKPSYADAYALRAWIQHFDGRPAAGLSSMERAVRLNPRIPSVYRLLRGALYYSQGDIDEALADFEAAVEISPNYQNLRIWLAAAYAAANRIDDANWESSEILALNPEFSASLAERAFPIRDPEYRQRFLNDLMQAGLPD